VIVEGFQLGGSCPDPIRQGGALDVDAMPHENLGLAVERQMVGILGDDHIGNERFRRQSTLDEACRRGGLHDTIGARAARKLWPTRHDYADLGRDLVKPP